MPRSRFAAWIAVGVLAANPLGAATFYDSGLLNFSTATAQSIWGEGEATRFEGTERLGVDIGGSQTVGIIAGKKTSTTIPTNPLWFAWKTCKSTVNIFCGDEPSRNNKTITTDTRTGGKVTATSEGFIGAEVSYLLDGGSVNADLDYRAKAEIPTVGIGEAFNLNTKSEWADGTLSAQTPTAGASVGTLVDIGLGASAEFCFIGSGCDKTGTLTLIDTGPKRQEIVGIDPSGIRYLDGFIDGVTIEQGLFDQTAELAAGVSVSGPSVTVTITSEDEDGNEKKTTFKAGVPIDISTTVAEAGITFPEASGSADLAGDGIALALKSDFLSAAIDVDAVVPVIPVGGLSVGLGPLSLSADAYDVKVGPTLDVFQDLNLKSDLFVDLSFDKVVEVGGFGKTTSWSGLWKNLPDFKLFERTEFSPVFSVVSKLFNTTGLSLGFDLTAKLFEIGASIDFGIVNVLDATLGPLFQKTIPLSEDFLTLDLFDKEFSLSGFEPVAGASFVVDPTLGADDMAPIPLPAGIWMLLSGFGAMVMLRRRRGACVGETLQPSGNR